MQETYWWVKRWPWEPSVGGLGTAGVYNKIIVPNIEFTNSFVMQASSHNESTSTLQFGARVSEITLGQAKKNVESGMMLDAKEASAKLQRETAAARCDARRDADRILSTPSEGRREMGEHGAKGSLEAIKLGETGGGQTFNPAKNALSLQAILQAVPVHVWHAKLAVTASRW